MLLRVKIEDRMRPCFSSFFPPKAVIISYLQLQKAQFGRYVGVMGPIQIVDYFTAHAGPGPMYVVF